MIQLEMTLEEYVMTKVALTAYIESLESKAQTAELSIAKDALNAVQRAEKDARFEIMYKGAQILKETDK